MEPGVSLQLVMPLATDEMVASGACEIEPHHLLGASLKFVEVEFDLLSQAHCPEFAIRDLLAIRDKARDFLAHIGCEVPSGSTALRRALRASAGHSASMPIPGSLIHRSRESRKLCADAEENARIAGAVRWEVADLLAAIFQNLEDYPIIADVVSGAGLNKPNSSSRDTEAFKQAGIVDLTRLARQEGMSVETSLSDPVCKSLMSILQSDGTRKHILLVDERGEGAEYIFKELAVNSSSFGRSESIRRCHFLQIDFENLNNALDVLARSEKVRNQLVICLSPIGSAEDFEAVAGGGNTVVTIAKKLEATLIVCVQKNTLEEYLEKKSSSITNFNVVWVHNIPEIIDL